MFDPHLTVGQIITEKEIHEIFECQTTFGIRMSKKNNLFVLMSGTGKKKKPYEDKWENDVLYYMGTDSNKEIGESQNLNTGRGNNNKQLRDVYYQKEGEQKSLFLFVKKESNKCIYKGPVKLIKEPYQTQRSASDSSKVWVFPLQLMTIDKNDNTKDFKAAEEESLNVPIKDLYKRIKGKEIDRMPDTVSRQHESKAVVYDRDPSISAYAKLRANGICDLCGNDAPFKDSVGRPYLEAHHIKWLSKGGADEIDNIVALCPNCHRKIHVIGSNKDEDLLVSRIKEYKIKEKDY